MVFNSFEFIVFFAVVYVVYRFLSHRAQNFFLLAASYLFYASWNWRFLFLLFFSTVVDYLCAKKIDAATDPKERKSWLILSLCVNFGILGFFKYFNFFAGSLADLFSLWGMSLDHFTLKVVLPVGVSFYTFQSISYMLDVYSNKLKAEKNFWDYALFVAFFPQLVAGPIERAQHMLPQYKQPRLITPQKNREGIWFIYWGFFLKVFVADNMERIVGIVFKESGQIPGVEVVLGSYAFAFQIFGDFAGYSFIAMGAARLLGFDLMTNFLFPYFVTNPRDFWRQWHISLSSWLRDYVYIPLGGNRNGELKTYGNLLLTMFLGGLWHGAAWTFGIWGLFHGVILCCHRLYAVFFKVKNNEVKDVWFLFVFKVIGMFHLTCLGWLIFRVNSLEQLKDMLCSLVFNLGAHSDKAVYLAAQIVFYAWLLLVIQIIQKHKNNLMTIPGLRWCLPWLFYVLMYYLMIFWGEFGGQQFIYFQF